MPTGEHRITLKKQNYEDSPTVTMQFQAKRMETLSGKQIPLLKSGLVTFNVAPASAVITLRAGNDASRVARPNETVFLKRGTYAYTIEAEHYESASGTLVVEPEKSMSVATSLAPAARAEPTPGNLLENPSLWSRRGVWWVLKTPDYAWLKPTSGAFRVTIDKGQLPWTRKKVEWTLDYRGEGEKIIYSASGSTLSRQIITAASADSQPVKTKFKDQPNVYRFILDISPTKIVVRDSAGKTIDEVSRPDPNLELGKIGFRGDMSISIEQLQ